MFYRIDSKMGNNYKSKYKVRDGPTNINKLKVKIYSDEYGYSHVH